VRWWGEWREGICSTQMILLIVQRHQLSQNTERYILGSLEEICISALSLIKYLGFTEREVRPVINVVWYRV